MPSIVHRIRNNNYFFIVISVISFLVGRKMGIIHAPVIPCPFLDDPELSISSRPCPQKEKQKIVNGEDDDECPIADPTVHADSTFVFKNDFSNSVLFTVFAYLHHPSTPVRGEFIVTQEPDWNPDHSTCKSIYMQRSGSRKDQPAKCIGIVRVPEGQGYYSPQAIGHRTGHIDWPQVLTDAYQDDFFREFSYPEERKLTDLFMRDREVLIKLFLDTVGEPFDEHGNRKTSIIMVANEGVMDLVLNFMCSGKAAGIDLSTFVVFLGQADYIDLIHSMGAKAIYHPSLGDMPKNAAENYADRTFAKVMWIKVTSVYIALAAGFNVIFQDADVVWIKDPIENLKSYDFYDMMFMDDGARTPRFSPFFTNTGFYFVRYNEKTLYFHERLLRTPGEIIYTGSHQATFIRHLTEAHYLFGLQILVLDDNDYPSGQMYHHQPEYVGRVKRYEKIPYVWHMCWTPSRDKKVEHLKDIGLWYLPPTEFMDGMCENSTKMLDHVTGGDAQKSQGGFGQILAWGASKKEKATSFTDIKDRCCVVGDYWRLRPSHVT